MRTGNEVRASPDSRSSSERGPSGSPARYGDTLELAVELPFETGAPMEAIRAAAAGEVHE